MVLKKGSTGTEVKELQTFLKINADGIFGSGTEQAVKNWQSKNGLTADGIVGDQTRAKMQQQSTGANPAVSPSQSSSGFDETYKNVTIEGSTFPGKPYVLDKPIKLNDDIVQVYIPALKTALPNGPKGLHLLLTIMTFQEGFKKGTRSYKTNNPGNIGNTDSGANQAIATLSDGILLQYNYINRIISGKHSVYPLNKVKTIPPYYSPEIAKNAKSYGLSPWLPGYRFTYTGQLDQFLKIYSTGARGGNGYINTVVSYFRMNGLMIQPDSRLQDIIAML